MGTDIGSITDINGNFQIRIPVVRSLLQFSFIGYETEEVEITDLSPLIVQLQPSTLALEELVVGYGSMCRSDITSSVASVRITNEDKKHIIIDNWRCKGRFDYIGQKR